MALSDQARALPVASTPNGLDTYIIRQFATGKLTHNTMTAALVTAGVKSRAESLGVEAAPIDTTRLRKPYMGRKKAVARETVMGLKAG